MKDNFWSRGRGLNSIKGQGVTLTIGLQIERKSCGQSKSGEEFVVGEV